MAIDFEEIERKLNEVLGKETPESLRKWLDKKRAEETQTDFIDQVEAVVMPVGLVYAPNSIWHGASLSGMASQTILDIELERLKDFVEFLFNDKRYLDRYEQSNVWDDFKEYELENQQV